MKNKILLYSILILIVIIVAAQFVSKENVLYPLKLDKSNSTLNDELSNFAVRDVESIDKIFIADKQNQSVTLTKGEDGWRVNNKFYAREDAIKNLLQAIEKMKVKRPTSKSEHNVQIKRLASQSRKVEIYKNEKLVKTYYVGGATQDQYGTYVLLEGSSVPFVVHIPGFLGFLTPRFFAVEGLWRENFIFKSNPRNISLVKVMNSENRENNFTVAKDKNNLYHILDFNDKELNNIDTLQIKRFLSNFKRLSYEAMITHMTDEKRDSLIHSKEWHTIIIEAGENNKQVVKTYHVANSTHYDDDGNFLKYDPDRMYGSFNNAEDLATLQFRTFDRITVNPRFFQKQ